MPPKVERNHTCWSVAGAADTTMLQPMQDSDPVDTARTVTCIECGCSSDANWTGWWACRCDEPEFGEPPGIAFYCPACADREFGRRPPRRVATETYDYELWDGVGVVATGRLQHDAVVNRGDRLRLRDEEAIVRHVLPETDHLPARLILQLLNE
jgi:hypothetical protein